MYKQISLLVVILIFVVGCSSNNNAAEKTTSLAEPQQVTNGRVANEQAESSSESFMSTQSQAPLPAAPAMTVGIAATAAPPQDMTFEDYGVNPFYDTEDDRLSTFAMDVDSASYTLARSYLMGYNQLPPADAIRAEEFINYFDADYATPEEEAFAIHMEAVPAPFGYDGHYLLRVGIQGKVIAPEDRQAALLIFVIDVSGSMDMENRLGLVKESLEILVGELREDDRVAIAVYSDNSRVVLEPTPASEADTILKAIGALRPEGSTNVDAGLRLGYALAAEHAREGQISRVVVLSDGVANVDVTSPDGILKNIREGVDAGITLSTIGFGMGNYNDVLMERLANDGNGNYYYIDNLRQARRIFVHNLTGTLQVIGYDAKVQVEFNPEVVDRYRLIGYENRAIADDDFRNDEVDAGEVGAGHSITALYEVALEDADSTGLMATAYIRYQDADSREVVELKSSFGTDDIAPDFESASPSLRLHAAAAEFAELLRGSTWAEGGSYVDLLDFAKGIEDTFPQDDDVMEFLDLIRLAGRYQDN